MTATQFISLVQMKQNQTMIIERLQMQSDVPNLHRSLLFKMAPYAAVPVVVPDLILAGHVSMVDGLKQRTQDAQKRGDLIDLS